MALLSLRIDPVEHLYTLTWDAPAGRWVVMRSALKSSLYWIYGAGINHLILHVYIHQPDERKPGITAWFGTAFNRHNTWFEPSKAFVDYTRRSP